VAQSLVQKGRINRRRNKERKEGGQKERERKKSGLRCGKCRKKERYEGYREAKKAGEEKNEKGTQTYRTVEFSESSLRIFYPRTGIA